MHPHTCVPAYTHTFKHTEAHTETHTVTCRDIHICRARVIETTVKHTDILKDLPRGAQLYIEIQFYTNTHGYTQIHLGTHS
jgi:hypothetical protein